MTSLETGLLTGCLTGFFALAGAFTTYRLQRATARDERMWDRRAETYVLLLQYHGSGMVEGRIDTATAPEWAVRDELTAKAKAFASDEVLGLWQKSAQAYRRLNDYVSEELPELTAGPDWQTVEDATEKDPELQKLHQASEQASEQLAAKIRAELDAHRRKWWQRRQAALGTARRAAHVQPTRRPNEHWTVTGRRGSGTPQLDPRHRQESNRHNHQPGRWDRSSHDS